jgi:hypothetical protein
MEPLLLGNGEDISADRFGYVAGKPFVKEVGAACAHERISAWRIPGSADLDESAGDQVAVTAIVRGRVTPERISVTTPSYAFPHSVVDSTSKAMIGQGVDRKGDAHQG